jgi:hypothetical protein
MVVNNSLDIHCITVYTFSHQYWRRLLTAVRDEAVINKPLDWNIGN